MTLNNLRALLGGVAASLMLLATGVAQAQAPAQPGQSAQAAISDYRLGAGDVIRISVFQNPDLTLETRVSEAGVVSYPLLGSVRVGGQSAAAAEKTIADGLRSGNFVKEPQVSVLVLQVRGHQASVLGQVNRPGRYALDTSNLRLSDLVAMAGGVAGTGADRVVVVGQRNGQPLREEIDLPSLFAVGGSARDLVIANGDTIWVDRQPLVYIYGEVQRPGPMRLEREMTLMQALATGGGLNARGTDRGIRVHRRGAEGKVDVIQPGMDEKLREGDIVFVRESLF